MFDEDQSNTDLNHVRDPLKVPNELITRARAKKLKKILNGFVQNIWVKMYLEELGVANEYEGQCLIHLIQNQVLLGAYVFDPKVSLVWSYFY